MSAALLCALLLSADDEGQLKDKLPPVVGGVQVERGIEIFASSAFSFGDTFFRKIAPSFMVGWHVTDTVSLSARGSYYFNLEASSMQVCPPLEGCRSPTHELLDGRAPGQLYATAGANLEWSPLYGKMSFMAESFGNLDLSLMLGAHLVGYRGTGGNFRPSVGGEVGLAMRIFITRWLAIRAEAYDLVYPEAVRVGERETTQVRNQLMAQLGFSLIFGSAAP